MTSAQFTRQDIVTWMIEEARADHNGLAIEQLTDTTYGVLDQEFGVRYVLSLSAVSQALTRWAKAVAAAPEDYCHYWVVAATAAKHANWGELDYDATISTRVVKIACGQAEQT